MINKIDERVKRLRFIDDRFLKVCFRDHPEIVEKVLQIIFNTNDIKVKDTYSQDYIANINGKSVILDIIAESTKDILYDIEVQRSDEGADIKRIRYISAMLDSRSLEIKKRYKDIGDTYIIFITENDYFKKGKQIYHINRVIKETKEIIDDGLYIMYINTSYKSNNELGKLCHDFRCENPQEMKIKELKELARYYKEDRGGLLGMSVLDEVKAEGIAEGKAEGIAEGKAEGIAEGKAECILGLLKKGILTLKIAANELSITEEECRTMIEKL